MSKMKQIQWKDDMKNLIKQNITMGEDYIGGRTNYRITFNGIGTLIGAYVNKRHCQAAINRMVRSFTESANFCYPCHIFGDDKESIITRSIGGSIGDELAPVFWEKYHKVLSKRMRETE